MQERWRGGECTEGCIDVAHCWRGRHALRDGLLHPADWTHRGGAAHSRLSMGAAGNRALHTPAYDGMRICTSAPSILAQPSYPFAQSLVLCLHPGQLRCLRFHFPDSDGIKAAISENRSTFLCVTQVFTMKDRSEGT